MLNRTPRRPAAGFTLLEALISILIVMVGLLGVAHLMLNSIGGTQLALRYTTASALAGEIVDRARSNQGVAANYAVAYGVTGADQGCGTTTPLCTPAAQAQHDVFRWKQQLAAEDGGLPAGDGEVLVAQVDGVTKLTVVVRWQDKDEELSYRLVAWL